MSLLKRYRATGADVLFGDPLPAHRGVSMEGYFWRITDPDAGRVIIALCGVNQGPRGPWATVGYAARPGGFIRTDALDGAWANPDALGVEGGGSGGSGGSAFEGDRHRLRVDLGPDARLDIRFTDLVPWPRRAVGGSSIFQIVPALNQYWHPWLLGGKATGTAIVGGQTWEFTDAAVYAEKNWGREGFPESWWWGQAQGFAEPDACVTFAGGKIHSGPLRTEVTGLVVKLPGGRVIRLGNPLISPVHTRTSDERWELSGRGFGWQVEIHATAPLDQAFILPVPLPGEHRNTAGDLEHLTGELSIEVRRFGRPVWSGRTTLAALEHGGLDRAQQELQRRGLGPETTYAPPVGL